LIDNTRTFTPKQREWIHARHKAGGTKIPINELLRLRDAGILNKNYI